MQANLTNISLIIDGIARDEWDDVEIDSDINTAADGWHLSLYSTNKPLPVDIAGGKKISLVYNNQPVLSGIIDKVSVSVTADRRSISISGRDYVGQLIDGSAEIFSGSKINLEQTIHQFVRSGQAADLFHNVQITPQYLSAVDKVQIEPSESIWSIVNRTAEAVGAFVWLQADGTLCVGNPFEDFVNPPAKTPMLQLNFNDDTNNVQSLEYNEDASELFSDVIVMGQGYDHGTPIKHVAKHPRKSQKKPKSSAHGQVHGISLRSRIRIITSGDVVDQNTAQLLAEKTLHNGMLNAYEVHAVVNDWVCATGEVWAAGWQVKLSSDVDSRFNGDWVIMGRTLKLNRSHGRITALKLKRKGDWMNPTVHIDKPKHKRFPRIKNHKDTIRGNHA